MFSRRPRRFRGNGSGSARAASRDARRRGGAAIRDAHVLEGRVPRDARRPMAEERARRRPRARLPSTAWGRPVFVLDQPHRRLVGRPPERSPYGMELGVTYPHAGRADAPDPGARQGALPAWARRRRRGPRSASRWRSLARRLNARPRTSSRLAVFSTRRDRAPGRWAFPGRRSPTLRTRGLEANRVRLRGDAAAVPAEVDLGERPQGKRPAVAGCAKGATPSVRVGSRWSSGCNTFPNVGTPYPGLFASLVHRQPRGSSKPSPPCPSSPARHHRRGWPARVLGRVRLRPPTVRDAGRRGPGRAPPPRRSRAAPEVPGDRLHRLHRSVRRAARSAKAPHAAACFTEKGGASNRRRPRLDRRLQGPAEQPRVSRLFALQRPDVHERHRTCTCRARGHPYRRRPKDHRRGSAWIWRAAPSTACSVTRGRATAIPRRDRQRRPSCQRVDRAGRASARVVLASAARSSTRASGRDSSARRASSPSTARRTPRPTREQFGPIALLVPTAGNAGEPRGPGVAAPSSTGRSPPGIYSTDEGVLDAGRAGRPGRPASSPLSCAT